ncbi:GapR family DNA-binding domain-containing protein [Azospirillum tabaci]|uniref:GapR family DNA-binding domain-containing protein n=1 Tax=Azospirillum tabaci TaxID=2752310 RepID=UPI00166117EC
MADIGDIAADRLKAFVRRALNLEAERAAIGEDIKEVYAEAKGTGFDTKTMRKVVARIKAMEKDREGVLEQEALEELYNEALGVTDGGAFDWGNMGRPNLHPGGKAQEPEQPDDEDSDQTDIEDIAPSPQRPAKGKAPKPDPLDTPQPPPVTEDEARAMARQDAEAGKPITSKPLRPPRSQSPRLGRGVVQGHRHGRHGAAAGVAPQAQAQEGQGRRRRAGAGAGRQRWR